MSRILILCFYFCFSNYSSPKKLSQPACTYDDSDRTGTIDSNDILIEYCNLNNQVINIKADLNKIADDYVISEDQRGRLTELNQQASTIGQEIYDNCAKYNNHVTEIHRVADQRTQCLKLYFLIESERPNCTKITQSIQKLSASKERFVEPIKKSARQSTSQAEDDEANAIAALLLAEEPETKQSKSKSKSKSTVPTTADGTFAQHNSLPTKPDVDNAQIKNKHTKCQEPKTTASQSVITEKAEPSTETPEQTNLATQQALLEKLEELKQSMTFIRSENAMLREQAKENPKLCDQINQLKANIECLENQSIKDRELHAKRLKAIRKKLADVQKQLNENQKEQAEAKKRAKERGMQYRLAQIEEIKELNDEIKELRKIIDQLMVSEEIQENRGGWPDTDSELGFPLSANEES